MRRVLHWLLASLLSAQVAAADPGAAAFEQEFARIAQGFPGAVTAGYLQGEEAPVVLLHGPRLFGGDASAAPVAPGAAWHIGSITKTMTAVLVMRLVERGVLDLDAPLDQLLPEADLHPDWQALTLRHLLGHTAGLRPNFTFSQMVLAQGDDLPAERRARLAAHWGQPLPGQVGSFAYSNMGYVLAGHIAEVRTGQPWEDLIRQDIAAPLGLASLGFGAPTGPGDPWGTRGLLRRPVDPTGPRADNPAWMGPAGTVHMSLPDLLRWGQANMWACQGRAPGLLPAEACQQLRQPVTDGYGLGWMTAEVPIRGGLTIYGHNGSNTLWIAHLYYAPEADTVIALAMNQARVMRSERDLLRLGQALLGAEDR